ncbi:glycosyltransferase family 4 protein [Pseudidiomarina sp. 1APP75-27a]|uniref:glycosyltransferase family 4 protein n=1 Tax=Pseudidiomarina terrestris TaxID=2820060 RepID=UPI002B057A90|nr:glycosyltransferase family 4 protein [Pseudidiomarina sp. 1APP75-27a]MEA3587670.1 glycosyltransferase family 4 protein [Pseudidiomarina sp. 1APP75-27a]
MNVQGKPNNTSLVVAHVGVRGGAGLYNKFLLKELISNGRKVVVAGDLSGYRDTGVTPASNDLNKVYNTIIFAQYSGVNFLRRLFFLFLAFLLIPYFIYRINRADNIREFDNIIFTSSIQMFEAYLTARVFPKKDVTIIVQENLELHGLFGFLPRAFLKSIRVLSITESWASYASNLKIHVKVLPNPIDIKIESCDLKYINEDKWDLIYVGGENKIKGFDTLLRALSLANEAKVSIVMLGRYSEKAIRSIEQIAKDNDKLTISVKGEVKNVSHYLIRSKVLILPIMSPHFCRPAIEASVCKMTFIVSDFPELEDFVTETNCIKFKRNDPSSLLNNILILLNDDELRKRLSANNHRQFSEKYSLARFRDNIEALMHERFI